MAKILALISIAMTCILLQSIQAATFECAEEPAACKTKFGTQFEKDFKEIHLSGLRKFMTSYIDKTNELKSELSVDGPYAKPLEESINVVRKSLQKLNDNMNDDKKIAEAFAETMKGITAEPKVDSEAKEFKNVSKLQNMWESLIDILREMGRDMGNLWAEMYSGLREKDLKAYPEYVEVNEHMENLRGNGERRGRGSDYTQAAEILSQKFNLPYFAANSDIS